VATRVLETGSPGVHRIGRYDLVAELASGGMATVYLARLSGVGGFQRTVAIKVLHPHLAYDGEFVEMFLDEARLAAMIHHPNVVPIQEVEEGEHGYYLVMDYIEGDTFAALLSRAAAAGQPVPQEVVLRIGLDMLAGLHAAHELHDERGNLIGVVHRDVSPQNVLVGTDGITRLTDFGVARAASRLSATRAGQLKGKLAYMAPEQASGDENLDRRADVFSAAVVLWEALALRRLFKASNEAATLSRVMNEPIRSPADFNPSVPAAVAQVILYGLSRDVNGRYATSAQFAEALEMAARHTTAIATNREVAAYVAQVVGADVEAHRAAIRAWLDKRDALGSSFVGAAAAAQVPVLQLRNPTFVTEPSQTFSSWSISGYPNMRTNSARPHARANLGSSRPPAVDTSGLAGFGAPVAYKPIPGYGPNGLPLAPAAAPSLTAAPASVPSGPGFVGNVSPERASGPRRRWALAGMVGALAVVVGLGVTYLGRSSSQTVEVTGEPSSGSLNMTGLSVQTTSNAATGHGASANSAAGGGAGNSASAVATVAPPASATSPSMSPSATIPAVPAPPKPELAAGASDPTKPPPVAAGGSGGVSTWRPSPRPAVAPPAPRPVAPKPAPAKAGRKRSVPNLDNPYQ
jgi:eukaryotic-like serine/threonine-protein kinase